MPMLPLHMSPVNTDETVNTEVTGVALAKLKTPLSSSARRLHMSRAPADRRRTVAIHLGISEVYSLWRLQVGVQVSSNREKPVH